MIKIKSVNVYFCYLSLFIIGTQGYTTFERHLILNQYDQQCLTEEFRRGAQLFVSYKTNLFDTTMKQYLKFISPRSTGIEIITKVQNQGRRIFEDRLVDGIHGYNWFDFQKDGNFTVCASTSENSEIYGDIKGRVDWVFSFFDNFAEYKEARAKVAKEENSDKFVNTFVIDF